LQISDLIADCSLTLNERHERLKRICGDLQSQSFSIGAHRNSKSFETLESEIFNLK